MKQAVASGRWRPAPYRPLPTRLGQNAKPLGMSWSPTLSVQSIGGMLLLSGSILCMIWSTDQRPLANVGRAATAAFGAYLVADETYRSSASLVPDVMNTFVLPILGMGAVVGALVGLGYMVLPKK